MVSKQRVCSRCISDSSIPGIRFDDRGICNFCKAHDELEKRCPLNELGQQKLDRLLGKIKAKGKGRKYDCVIGFSGGTDSTYLLYMAKKLGLRPLAVHFDNGWDTDIAINNMEKAVAKLGVDLKTVTCDWEEFKDLQISFLRASVSDADIPTDIGIISVLYRVAAEEGIHYVLGGHSFRVEGLDPLRWTYMDGKYIKSVQKSFGEVRLKSFPNLTISNLLYYVLVKRIRVVPLLALISYNKENSKRILEREFDWTYYGSHHFGSLYTRFVIVCIRWKKFHIDQRLIEYSALIRSNQMTRGKALKIIREKPILEDDEILKYVIEKLGLTAQEFEGILSSAPRSFLDYPTYYPMIRMARIPIRIACKLGLLPEIFYQKYFHC